MSFILRDVQELDDLVALNNKLIKFVHVVRNTDHAF